MARANQNTVTAGQNEKTESQSQNANPQNAGDANQEGADADSASTTPAVEDNSTGNGDAGKQQASKNGGDSKIHGDANIEKKICGQQPCELETFF